MIFAGQYWSSTLYVKGPVMSGANQGAFGFNFADGHIKSYGSGLDLYSGAEAASSGLSNGPVDGKAPGNYVRCVSGDEGVYRINAFTGIPGQHCIPLSDRLLPEQYCTHFSHQR
jgi:hypothetical protein